ncbi:MAG: lipopolysaccharide heptosyltransferase II [Verrucomicrobiae bacterium]|nr:lipopolysaccharide heptosyltransferase II [Verrucomicrobiae bacterium]
MPTRGFAPLARAAATVGWALAGARRRLVLRNLEIFSKDRASSAELRRLGREAFRRLAENALWTVWMGARSDAELRGLFELRGVEENLRPALARGRGVVAALFHLGHWEALARAVAGVPGVEFAVIYQPLRNASADALVREWRARANVALINRHASGAGGFGEIARRLRRGGVVGVLVDQHAGDHGMWVPFLGRMASTTILPALLARRTGAAIVPVFCRATGRNAPKWSVEYGAPIPSEGRSDGAIMEAIHAQLEAEIRRDPAAWFWLHDRWKTPSPNILFPAYRRGWHADDPAGLQPFHILVRTPNWLGDAVMSIPALRAIRAGRPDCRLALLTPPKLASLWAGQSYVDKVFTSLREVPRGRYEAAVLFPNSLRTAIEAWRLGIPRRFGAAGHRRRALLTAVCPESFRASPVEHQARDFLGLARWLGGATDSTPPRLDLPEKPCASKSPRVILHPGAAYGSAKRWLPERFVELVRRNPDLRWTLVGNGAERGANAALAARMGAAVEDRTGAYRLDELAALMAAAAAVVCNDSGPMHLAAAVGARVIAVFGSTDPSRTGPLGEGHRVLRVPVECSPCFLRECPTDLRCMKAVSVEAVERALREVLTS